MRRYDDPVDVRKGLVPGAGGVVEGPEQFLWKGRLWKVSAVVAQWVETGAWWHSSGVHAVLGAEDWDAERAGGVGAGEPGQTATAVRTDLATEREVWRVQAARGMGAVHEESGAGVFDLVFDWADGGWRLSRCLD
jgi:Family of unknown function (DUF6504)